MVVVEQGQELIKRYAFDPLFVGLAPFKYPEVIVLYNFANKKYLQGQPVMNNTNYDTLYNELSNFRVTHCGNTILSSKTISYLKLIELQDIKEYSDEQYKKGKPVLSNSQFDLLSFEITRRYQLINDGIASSLLNSFVCANWSDVFVFDVLYYLESQYTLGNTKLPNLNYDVITREYEFRKSLNKIFFASITQTNPWRVPLPPVVFPSHWSTPVTGIDIIELDSNSPEFQRLELDFKSSLPSSTIYSIKRIQNYGLYRMHYYQRLVMGQNHGRKSISDVEEQTLYHGCRLQPGVDAIIKDGFSRQYCPGGAIGDGCYYALRAVYSNQGPYVLSFPDKTKQLFIVKVLVGKSTAGASGMKQVPLLYESVNDGPYSMYCIFNHNQAYPEYTIHYQSP